MQDKIAIILPVRDGGLGRHKRLIRCLDSYKEMTQGLSDIHLLHDMDECSIYHAITSKYPEITNYCIPLGLSLMEKINVHALDIASRYKYIGFIGDDIVFKTVFEKQFIEQLASLKSGLVYGNDLVWHGKLATHPFITSNAILAVGFFGCPAVKHNYFDNYWHKVFSTLGSSVYFPGVVMEHIHPASNKEYPDEIYYRILKEQDTDSITFQNYLIKNFNNDLEKIRLYV